MPNAMPVKMPEALTVAIDVLVLDHVPPPVVLLKVVDEPRDKEDDPLMADSEGVAVTVTDEVAAVTLPQLLEAVSV